jgi:hypothetical protein
MQTGGGDTIRCLNVERRESDRETERARKGGKVQRERQSRGRETGTGGRRESREGSISNSCVTTKQMGDKGYECEA